MGRLSVISVVALALLFVSFDLGFGVLGGLAVFQLTLLVNVARSMARMGPAPESVGSDVIEATASSAEVTDDEANGGN